MLRKVYEQITSLLEDRVQDTPDARYELILELARIGLKCFEGKEPVCWLGVNFPIEIPLALGYLPFYPEIAPAQLASVNLSAELIEAEERISSNLFCCSFHRCSHAAVDFWPKPAAIVGTSNICDGQVKLFQLLGRRYDIKPILVEFPIEATEDAVDYVESQLRQVIAQLEDLKGEKLDEQKLKNVIQTANQARQGIVRINELRKQVPCLLHGARAFNAINTSLVQIWATSRLPQLYEQLIKETEERRQRGNDEGERFRLFLMVGYPSYKTLFLDCLEKELGAIVVMDEMSNAYWDDIDEANPIRGLAYKTLHHPLCGTIEKRAERACRLSQDYKIDGVIHVSHWGCRQTSGGVGVLRERLAEIDIPFLNVDLDIVDPRTYSPGQLKTRLQGFVEMLSDRQASEIC